MDTKTLVEDYTNDHTREEILNTEFVIVSTRIQAGKEENVFKSGLYSERVIFALDGEYDRDFEIVYDKIMKSTEMLGFIIKLMTFVLVEKRTVVLLCSPCEMKTKYIELVSNVIETLFKYPVIDYKKDKYKTFHYDPVVVAKRIKKMSNYLADILLEDEDNRKKAVKMMSKKEMKKELKKLDMYHKDMSKSEMKDMLQTFYVERDD